MNANALNGKDGAWVGDGSEGTLRVDSTTTTTNASTTVTVASATQGTPFNAYFKTTSALAAAASALSTSTLYFQVEIAELQGNLSVGFVTETQVQPGWKTRGMFYNGNLTNGSAALKTAFGDYLKAGYKVGMMCETIEGMTNVYVFVNGNCLGKGFAIPADTSGDDVMMIRYPCLHVSGTAKVVFTTPETIPPSRERQNPSNVDPYVGDWKLVKAFFGPELGSLPLPPDTDIVAALQASSDSEHVNNAYSLSLKVANTLNTTITKTGNKMEAFDCITVTPLMSTMMMPPPELQTMEREISQALPILTKMIISDNGFLLLQGPTAELQFQPHVKTFEPVTKYR